MSVEKEAGRSPVRLTGLGVPDIISLPKRIEVKAVRSLSDSSFAMSAGDVEAAKDEHYFVYVVAIPDDLSQNPELRVLDHDRIQQLLTDAWVTYRIRSRSPVVQGAPGIEALTP